MSTIPPVSDLQSRRQLETLESFVGAILWLDKTGRILYCNAPFLDHFNLSKEQIEDSLWKDLDQDFDTISFSRFWDKLCNVGQVNWNTTLLLPTQETHDVFVEGRIVQNDFCELACLRISEPSSSSNGQAQLTHLLADVTEAVAWSWKTKTGEFQFTDTFYELFEIDQHAHTQDAQNITQLIQPYISNSQLQELKSKLQTVLRHKKEMEFQWKVKLQETSKYISFSATPIFEGEAIVGAEGIIKESASLVGKTRIQLLAEEVMQKSTDLILVLNEDLDILRANPSCEKALGYAKAEMIRQLSILNIDIENSASQWKNHLAKLSDARHIRLVTSFRRKNNTIFPVEMTLTYYQDRQGVLICMVAKDISELRKSESEIHATLAQKESLTRQLEEEKSYLIKESSKGFKLENIITGSDRYESVLQQAMQVAPTNSTVLIEGETGTGKELLARAIHRLSPRSNRTMITVNCANLPDNLIGSELFGHEKGAFTGATKQKKGRFELAHKGTIFLDEIGELPLDMQPNLLRILQEGEFERLGGTQTIQVDVRIIAATNRNLSQMVDKKTFREDLFYRLNVFPIHNIPLRDRKEDIEVLAYHFLEKFCKKMNRKIDRILEKDLKRLRKYHFPGNIRELENIVERSVILTSDSTLNLDFWQPNMLSQNGEAEDFPSLEEIQRAHILEALRKTKWRISGEEGAAKLLKLKDQTLFSKIRKLGISRND